MIGTSVGHIRIVALLGQGGMGEVYLGEDDRLQRRVALKAIRNEKRLSTVSRDRLLREARALSSLDHPNICRIYDYAEGPLCDFLVLELVEGVTLQRAVEEGMSRARKLRIARDIVRALAAAHRRGIIHRDLKPENIMITRDDTVKVLDFGLARAMAAELPQPEDDDFETTETLIYSERTGAAVVGTPLYMSPEQARSASVTTASDLYSFGLVLQFLLTEQTPRRGTVHAALQMATNGERLPMTGQPRHLTALVERLTSIPPAERPTAVETLEQLERVLATPARRARMIAAAVVAAFFLGGGVKYTVDVTTARRDAERRRNQAESLVTFMVSDLPKRLEPVGRLDVLDGAATKALDYFASLRPDELSGDEVYRHALALTQLGDVRVKQGKLPEALALFKQSLRFAEAAVAQDPARDEWQLALSNSHFWVGDALRRQGDGNGALQQFRAYYDISARLAAKHPGDAKYETELSYGHSNLGSAYEVLGDLRRAEAEYRTVVDLDRRRAARDPRDEQRRADLANSINKLGVVLQAGGDLSAARAAFAEDVAIRRALSMAKPDDVRRADRLAISLAYLGTALANTGETEQAIAANREELAIAGRLTARDEANLDWQRHRAIAQVRLVDTMGERGALGEVATLLEDASATLTRLTARDARPSWRRDLAAAHHQRAQLLARRGDDGGAAKEDLIAVTLAEGALAAQKTDTAAVRVLCEALSNLGERDARQQRSDLARERFARVLSLAAKLPNDRDPRVNEAVARALFMLGRGSEAAALVERLRQAGYRRPEFVARWRLPASPS